jgi:cell division protein FtsN
MMMRALIVLLVILNVGVAAWWLGRNEPVAAPAPATPIGVATLELLAPPAATAPAAVAAVPVTTELPASAVCFRTGPYVDRGAAERSAIPLGARALKARARELPAAGASGYRVLLPPSSNREQAQALAQRVGAAGFSDYLVVNDGDEANSVALGRYRSRDAALRRQDQLIAAGFDAQLRASGRGVASQFWLEVATPAQTQAAEVQRLLGSTELAPLDCAGLR